MTLLVLFAFTVAFAAPQSRAQADRGTLLVTVKAASGTPPQKIRVRVRNTANEKAAVARERDGSPAEFRSLPAGTYEITASAPGFFATRVTRTVRAGSDETAELVLRPAGAATGEAKQPTNSTSESVSSGTMNNLPLNGRSTSELVALEPGVIKAKTQSNNGPRGFGTQMEIFGSRPRDNDSRLDGISVNDYANGPMGNAIGISLGVDALDQLSVLTTNDEARYGRTGGGYISSSTRSGANAFHGSVFYYVRNSAFDARNYFDQKKPAFRRNQFGVAAGGPLWKNKTFWFGDYEGIRQSQGVTHVSTVPSPAARMGDLSTGTVTVDPEVKRYLDAFYPSVNGTLLGAGDTGTYVFSGQKVTPGNHFTTRIDEKFSKADLLYGVYVFDRGSVTQPDPLNTFINKYDSSQQFFTVGYTHSFSTTVVNQLRFGVNRVVSHNGITLPGANAAAEDTSFGIVPGDNAPRINVAGLTSFWGGLNSLNPFTFHWTSIQAYDDLSLVRGKHTWQFGVAFERMRDDMVASSDPNGHFFFNSLSDFLTNQPFELSVALSEPSRKGIRQTRFGIYAQDDWRVRTNFALHLGLRYEMVTVPTEVHGELSTLRNLTDAQPHLGTPLISNPTLHNFEPRIGLAWDPLGGGNTVVSSSFGIFDVLPLPYEFQFAELFASPSFQSRALTDLPAGSFPTEAYSLAVASPTSRAAYFQPNPGRNYVMQWNFDVEHQFSPDLSVKLGYVGSHGVHQVLQVNDANIVLPTLTPQGYLWPSPAGSGTRLNPNFGRIESAFWTGDSSYNALVLQVRGQTRNGLQIAGSFTWGKSIDTSSGSISGNEYQNSISSPLWFAPRLNRGLSDFDVAKDLKILGSWQIPPPPGASGLTGWALSGWQIGGVLEASSGVPFTPGIAGDPLGVNSSDPSLDVPNVVSGPNCQSLVNPGDPTHYVKTQCFAMPNPLTLRGNAGRSLLIGPSLINLDSSLFKNNYVRKISDTFNIQFRAEFFNVLNHTNFKAPLNNRFLFDSQGNPLGSAGLIDGTQDSSREIQFALRLIW